MTAGDSPNSFGGLTSSFALIASQVAKLFFGAAFWTLAARRFSPGEVGLAAGAVAMMGICINVGFLGAGASVIRLFPDFREQARPLLVRALGIVTMSSLALSALLLVAARWTLEDLDVVSSNVVFASAFLAGCVLGALVVLGDQISIAMWRGQEALFRSLAAGALMVGALITLDSLGDQRAALVILICWTFGAFTAVLMNAAQIVPSVRIWRQSSARPSIKTKRVLKIGLPNHLLSVIDVAPAFVLTVVVTEVIDPESAAYWYTLWMAATAVFIIPGTFGMTLFAAAADARTSIGGALRQTLRGTLAVGGMAALLVVALADEVLRLFGEPYADAGATPLRLLMIGIIPLAFTHAYLGVCRASDRLWEAAAVVFGGGTFGVVCAAVAGERKGLVGVAAAWLAAQVATGTWAMWRLKILAARRAESAALPVGDL